MSLKKISILLLFVAAFLNGLSLSQNFTKSANLWVACSLLIVSILGVSKITKLIKEKADRRKVIAAILIILVLIPLVFLGTCLLGFGGAYMREMFIR